MSRITWVQHPTIAGQTDAVINGSHVAWIRPHNWGGHTSYIVKSYVARLNNFQFESPGAAMDWIESNAQDIDPDKNAHMSTAENIRTADLDRVKHLVKLKKLAELAGLNPASIAQKVGRGTELTVSESEAMTKVMVEAGVIVERRA